MSETVEYKKYIIKSTPNRSNEERSNFIVNGVIGSPLIKGKYTYETMQGVLGIPDNEMQHDKEEDADRVFVRYAKKYLDSLQEE